MLNKIKKIEPLVEKLLEEQPAYRDNQNQLFIRVCMEADSQLVKDYDFGHFYINFTNGEYPPFESVSRARRMVQERREDLRGKNYKGRKKAAEEVKQSINL